jgi:xanthine dehydrogenase FAD-binding subunit
LQDLDYRLAHRVDEIISLLSKGDGDARILCGGTDLLVQLREGRKKARLLIDIKGVTEANQLSYTPQEGLRLGAAISCARICADPTVQSAYPGLLDAVSLIGGVQIQSRASVGGNLCNASPAADTIPALIVHSAVCVLAGPGGWREMAVESFCTGPGQNALLDGEFLVWLHLPPPPPAFGAAYLRFIPRNEMDIAVTGAGASVLLDEGGEYFRSARLALGAVAPTPLFIPQIGEWLSGKKVTSDTICEASRIAEDAAQPIDDMRGRILQRKHLAVVLSQRALDKAVQRARGSR